MSAKELQNRCRLRKFTHIKKRQMSLMRFCPSLIMHRVKHFDRLVKEFLVAERLSESVHIVDHDPSLAFYRLQEHVGKSLPALNNKKYSIAEANVALQGACFDLDNIICAVQSMEDASHCFLNIKKMLLSCEEYRRQLNLSNILQQKDSLLRTRNDGVTKKNP